LFFHTKIEDRKPPPEGARKPAAQKRTVSPILQHMLFGPVKSLAPLLIPQIANHSSAQTLLPVGLGIISQIVAWFIKSHSSALPQFPHACLSDVFLP
jgi:hypothetical protein